MRHEWSAPENRPAASAPVRMRPRALPPPHGKPAGQAPPPGIPKGADHPFRYFRTRFHTHSSGHPVQARSLPFALLLAAPLYGVAQGSLVFLPDIPVSKAGINLGMPWAGGLDAPHFSAIDLDQDGLMDLFALDRQGNRPIFLLNTGSEGQAAYTPTRAYDQVAPFPDLHDWALLRDYDCDGKADIFAYTNGGFAVYRNTSDASGLSFEMAYEMVGSNYVPTISPNLYVSNVDLPGIADVDGDGDLDILTYSIWGNLLEYHKNLGMELYGTCDSLVYEVRSRCWGDFQISVGGSAITLDVPCPFNVPNPELPVPGGAHPGTGHPERAHSGNTILPLDLNGDGLTDLVLGDFETPHITALVNGGSAGHALMITADSIFPSGVPAHFREFLGAFHVDVDGDGNRDLVVAPNTAVNAENTQGTWYYRNTGSDASPAFTFQRDDLFQGDMLDFGTGARPVLFDHNGDGLMDLIVANTGRFQPLDGTYRGGVALLENVGTAQAPAFNLVTEDYGALGSLGPDVHPTFGDITGDGRADMVVGDVDGRLHFFPNTSTGPVAAFPPVGSLLTDDMGAVIDVGANATPQLFDLDGDGRLDLLVGERSGNLNYFRNTGTANLPQWHLESAMLGGVSVNEYWSVTGYSVPFFYRDINNDIILLAGSEQGGIHRYDGITGNIGGTWNLADSLWQGLHEGVRTAVAMHDFTGTGTYNVVVGNARGGLSFWQSDEEAGETASIGERGPVPFILVPNPARHMVDLMWNGTWVPGLRARLVDGLGRVVRTVAVDRALVTIPLDDVVPGLYLVQVHGGATPWAMRLAVVR